MFHKILNSQAKTIAFAAFLLGVSGLTSDFLALIRDRMLAGKFGAGQALDVYFAAFRIPDFVYGLLVMGGISAVFLPVFSELFHKSDNWAWEATNNLLNVFLLVIIGLCALLALFAPFIINLIVPGFNSAEKSQVVTLTRIMFLSPVLFSLSSIMSGILQYFHKFLIYSLAPILYNLGIIFGIVYLVPRFGVVGLAYGVILGAALHLAIQVPAARNSGWHYKWIFNWRDATVRKVLKLTVPRMIGTAAYNINLIIITVLASTFAAGSIAIFNFSSNLQSFPVGIIGSSFALAAFPMLSRTWADGKKEEFLDHFSLAVRQILFLVTPVSVLMLLLRAQIVRLILGTGQFGWTDTRLTAASLGLFSLGIFAATLIPLLSRAFFSLHDTRTPMIIGLISISLNIFLSFNFAWAISFPNIFRSLLFGVLDIQDIKNAAVIALPLALSTSGIFQCLFLFSGLKKRLLNARINNIWIATQKFIYAGALMSLAVFLTLRPAATLFNLRTSFGVFLQAALASFIGIAVYLAVLLLLKSQEIKTVISFILERLGYAKH